MMIVRGGWWWESKHNLGILLLIIVNLDLKVLSTPIRPRLQPADHQFLQAIPYHNICNPCQNTSLPLKVKSSRTHPHQSNPGSDLLCLRPGWSSPRWSSWSSPRLIITKGESMSSLSLEMPWASISSQSSDSQPVNVYDQWSLISQQSSIFKHTLWYLSTNAARIVQPVHLILN